VQVIIGRGNHVERLMLMSKTELIRYARKVQAALPDAGVIVSGTKADIAYQLAAVLAAHPEG
jgi:hypothetical protein